MAGFTALMAGPVIVMLLVGWTVAFGRFENGRLPAPQPLTGITVPKFSIPVVAKPEAKLADSNLRGKVSIVNFWASWCVPCREEMPLLRDLAEAPGVVLFGVNSHDRAATAQRFLSQVGDPFHRIGIDADGALAKAWGVYGLPATFVVDAEGKIAYALIGPLDLRVVEQDIVPLIERLLIVP